MRMLMGFLVGAEFALYDWVSVPISREVACKNTVDD